MEQAQSRRLRDAQGEDELAPDAHLALDPHTPFVGLDDSLDDGEPQSDAAAVAAPALPVESEDVRQLVRWHPWPGVAHRDPDFRRTLQPRLDRDAPSLGGELDRVADEVREHLLD